MYYWFPFPNFYHFYSLQPVSVSQSSSSAILVKVYSFVFHCCSKFFWSLGTNFRSPGGKEDFGNFHRCKYLTTGETVHMTGMLKTFRQKFFKGKKWSSEWCSGSTKTLLACLYILIIQKLIVNVLKQRRQKENIAEWEGGKLFIDHETIAELFLMTCLQWEADCGGAIVLPWENSISEM